MNKNSVLLIACSLLLSAPVVAQTFEIDGQPAQTAPATKKGQQKSSATSAQSSQSGQNGIGWGSSIEVGRLARAAEDALRHGDPANAADYAQRAVKAAPQDNKLWFLLGYTSRLAGRYQVSLDAYQHGLQMNPGNADGMSGLAQTYARMGRTDEAEKLLSQVIRANPNRTNDLLIAGELYMRTGNTQQAIDLLQRAESQKPEPARRADAGHRLSQAEAAAARQADARSGEETRAEQRRNLSGCGQLLSRAARLQGRHPH